LQPKGLRDLVRKKMHPAIQQRWKKIEPGDPRKKRGEGGKVDAIIALTRDRYMITRQENESPERFRVSGQADALKEAGHLETSRGADQRRGAKTVDPPPSAREEKQTKQRISSGN